MVASSSAACSSQAAANLVEPAPSEAVAPPDTSRGARPADELQHADHGWTQAPDDDADDCPLFLMRPPRGENAALSAIAALIDEDEPEPARGRKRGIGDVQVVMALSGLSSDVQADETPAAKRGRGERAPPEPRSASASASS